MMAEKNTPQNEHHDSVVVCMLMVKFMVTLGSPATHCRTKNPEGGVGTALVPPIWLELREKSRG